MNDPRYRIELLLFGVSVIFTAEQCEELRDTITSFLDGQIPPFGEGAVVAQTYETASEHFKLRFVRMRISSALNAEEKRGESLGAARDAAVASSAALREALEFYADEAHWNSQSGIGVGRDGEPIQVEEPGEAYRHGPTVAAAALREPAGAELLAERDRLRKLCGEAGERMLYAWRVLLRDQWLEADSEPYRALGECLKEAADGK